MDADGMIGRKTKNVTLWSASKKLCKSFLKFLERNGIAATLIERLIGSKKYYCVKIKSAFVRKFGNIIGFSHPRKKMWLDNHLKKEFYVKNYCKWEEFLINGNIIEYHKIFDEKVYIINGKSLLGGKGNIKFVELFSYLLNNGWNLYEIYSKLASFRWKMSKGSATSVKLPLRLSKELKEISKFVRIKNGGIRLSRNYVRAWNINPEKIIKKISKIFDIEPHYTGRGEIIFTSGVLEQLFSKILKRCEHGLQ